MTDSTAANADAGIQRYEVLYYKRTMKVHTSKGVSKMDGILLVHPPPSHVVRLESRHDMETANKDDDDDDDSNDDDDDAGKKHTRHRKSVSSSKGTSSKKTHTLVVYNAIHKDMASRVLRDDEILHLGGYEVQVVAVLSALTFNTAHATRIQTLSPATTTTPLKSSMTTSGTSLGKRSLPGTALHKRILPSKPLVTPQTMIVKKSVTGMKRVPPVQPKRILVSEQDRHDDEVDIPTVASPPLMTPFKRPKLVSSTTTTTLTSRTSRGTPVNKITDSAKEAWHGNAPTAPSPVVLPHVPLPASIQKVLRPHQITGVEFLWKALTDHAGAILADEMGLVSVLFDVFESFLQV
jgi:hypothetical protein